MFNFKLTLISNDPDTHWGVHDYLTRSGASLSSSSRLEQAAAHAESSDAVLLFADDYPRDAVVDTIKGLPATLVVLITAFASDFALLQGPSDLRATVIVLTRPTWGWMVLDAIRSGVRSRADSTS